MGHDGSMAAAGDRLQSVGARLTAAIDDYAAALRQADGAALGEGLIHTREAKDRLECVFAEGFGASQVRGVCR